MVDIHRSNPRVFEQMDVRFKELQEWDGITGWPEDNRYPAGQQVAYIAQIQEFGHGKIPPRPFMRPAVDKNKSKWFDYAAFQAQRIIDGHTDGKTAMTKLAKLAAEDVQESMNAVKSPPLSDITLWARYYRKVLKRPVTGATIGEIAGKLKSGELKGMPPSISDKPLIDTEQMFLGIVGEAVQS